MEYISLNKICDVRDGTHDSPQYVLSGYPLVTSKNIVDGKLDLSTVNYISQEDYDKINARSKVDVGDVIMPMIGTIGNPFLVNEYPNYAIKNVALIKFPNKNISNRFIWYFLRSGAFKKYVSEKNKGGTQKFLSLGDIRNMDVPLVSLDNQLKIVEKLDYISQIIDKRILELNALDRLIKARFVEMFSDIEDNCDVGYYIKSLTAGKSLAGEAECENKVLKTGAASFDYFDSTQIKNLPLDYEPQAEHLVCPGDIIISRMNTAELTGAAAYVWAVQDKVYLPDRLWKANLKEMCNPIFVWQMLIQPSTKEQIRRECSGTSGSMKNISKSGMLAIKVKRVPFDLQNQFAEFVKQVDKSKSVVQKSLDESQLLFDKLMQEYFG